MPNLYNNLTVQNIREFLESQLTSNTHLCYNFVDGTKSLYNIKVIWGGDTYYVAYSDTEDGNPTKFLPINASNICCFELV